MGPCRGLIKKILLIIRSLLEKWAVRRGVKLYMARQVT